MIFATMSPQIVDKHKHVVHENLIGGSSIILGFPLVIADSERDMPGIQPWAPRLVHQRSEHWATTSDIRKVN
jgi:hypothetical protein